eukprot:3247772-Lingulodinium_polyedra.AAC.1
MHAPNARFAMRVCMSKQGSNEPAIGCPIMPVAPARATAPAHAVPHAQRQGSPWRTLDVACIQASSTALPNYAG